jgi:hypothetical protein
VGFSDIEADTLKVEIGYPLIAIESLVYLNEIEVNTAKLTINLRSLCTSTRDLPIGFSSLVGYAQFRIF